MSSVIWHNGRIVARSFDVGRRQTGVHYDHGEVHSTPSATARQAASERAASLAEKERLQIGSVFTDKTTGLSYTVAQRLLPKDGWGTTEFWLDRWNIDLHALHVFVRNGYLVGSVEHGSRIFRYRVVDEARLKKSIHWRDQKNRLLRDARNKNKAEKTKK